MAMFSMDHGVIALLLGVKCSGYRPVLL